MQDIRRKYENDITPRAYDNRMDFVMSNEVNECCKLAGERYGIDLKDLAVYYKLRIYKCKL